MTFLQDTIIFRSKLSVIQEFSQETLETKNKHILQNTLLMVPYSGKQRHQLLSKMKKELKTRLPKDIKAMITYKSTKLLTKFPAKDKTGLFYY